MIVPPKFQVIVVPPESMEALVQLLVAVIEHSGNEAGVVKSLRVAVGEFEARVSAKKVEKQGALANIVFRSKPISRNSPFSKLVVDPKCLSVNDQGAATFWSGTIPHRSF